jgi:hypothetical protein
MRCLYLLPLALCMAAPAAAQTKCPWMNAATAGGLLGGPAQLAVTASTCEYIRRADGREMSLRIEVTSLAEAHSRCTEGEPLKGIGNEARACSYEAKAGRVAEQVTGVVRDRAFVVRVSATDASASRKSLRGKARDAAEQVAGILF